MSWKSSFIILLFYYFLIFLLFYSKNGKSSPIVDIIILNPIGSDKFYFGCTFFLGGPFLPQNSPNACRHKENLSLHMAAKCGNCRTDCKEVWIVGQLAEKFIGAYLIQFLTFLSAKRAQLGVFDCYGAIGDIIFAFWALQIYLNTYLST